MIKSFLILICFLLLNFLSCSERDRLNPFDPSGNIKSPVELSVSPMNQSAKLDWTIQDITDYKGFRLYRAIDNENYSLYQEFPPETRSFTDTNLEYYHWYYYRITVLGYQTESTPSPAVKIFPGPGTVWLLSRYGYSIHQLSYDLNHSLKVYYTNYPPINWDIDLSHNEIWMAHAQYRYVTRLNLMLGYEDFFLQNHFERPIDIKIDRDLDRICILDPSRRMIFLLRNRILEDSLSLSQNNFFKMGISHHSDMIVINDSLSVIFNANGEIKATINFGAGFVGRDIIVENDILYILLASQEADISKIIIYDLLNLQSNQITLNGIFNLFSKPKTKNYFYASETIQLNSERLVKLSGEGNRLLELPVLHGIIDDIAVNPVDHSVVILQRYEDLIMLYDSLGQKISSNDQIYDPIKVFIQ